MSILLRNRFSSDPKEAKSNNSAKYSDKFLVHLRPLEFKRLSRVETNLVMQDGRRIGVGADVVVDADIEVAPPSWAGDDDDAVGSEVDADEDNFDFFPMAPTSIFEDDGDNDDDTAEEEDDDEQTGGEGGRC